MSEPNGSGFNPFDPLGVFDGVSMRSQVPFDIPLPKPILERQSGDDYPGLEAGEQVSSEASSDAVSEASDLEAAASTGAEYLDQVESVLEDEDCEMCKSLLVSLRSRPLEEQVKGVNELSELKQAIVDDASPEEVDKMMDDFDVLDDPSEYI